jgi:hypothetical protein
LLINLCASNSLLPSGDADGGYHWVVQTPDGWTPYWDPPQAYAASEGGVLGQDVALISTRVSLSLFSLISAANSYLLNFELNL